MNLCEWYKEGSALNVVETQSIENGHQTASRKNGKLIPIQVTAKTRA